MIEHEDYHVEPVVSMPEQAMTLLIEGTATFIGTPDWMLLFHRLFTDQLFAINFHNYTWDDFPAEDAGMSYRVYRLVKSSTLVH